MQRWDHQNKMLTIDFGSIDIVFYWLLPLWIDKTESRSDVYISLGFIILQSQSNVDLLMTDA